MHAHIILQWLHAVDDDLKAIRQLLLGDPVVTSAAYHCQQAGEKLVKTVLIADQLHPPRTHDILALLEMLRTDHPLGEMLRPLQRLTPFVWVFRYPGPGWNDDGPANPPTLAELEGWLNQIQSVRREVAAWLTTQGILPSPAQ